MGCLLQPGPNRPTRMAEADPKRREAEEMGEVFGRMLAEQTIELFGDAITTDEADATAKVLRSEIVRVGGEMMDEGIAVPLVIAWGESCARALQERLVEHGGHLVDLAKLLAPEPGGIVPQ
jgi:hypothetical protein